MKSRAIHAANPSVMTGTGNWTYLLDGPAPTLIDAGVGQPDHLNAIAAARAEGPGHVLITHAHPDHIAGVPAIAQRWPATTFAKFPWPQRDAAFSVEWQTLVDGARIPAGDGHLTVMHTPGHAPDHLTFWDEDTRTAFTGDLLVHGSSVAIQPSYGGDLTTYLQSLERIRQLAPRVILPAHGRVIEDPLALIEVYLDHRREREAQILEALGRGLHTADELVADVYRDVARPLLAVARESVLAHLRKLEVERRARREDDGWRLY